MNDHLPVPVEPTPLLLIQQALTSGMKPADLRELFELQRDHARDQAERAYADALTAFQVWCPPIHKSKSVEGKYSYAPFEKIMQVILPGLRENRIVITFDTAVDGASMVVHCRTRVGVVEKITSVELPVPPANKLTNATQTSVGAISYGKRTALIAALNLVCTDEDTDGVAVDETITPAQQEDLDEMLKGSGFDTPTGLARLLKWIGDMQGSPITNFVGITTISYPKIVAFVQKKKAERKAGAK